MPLDALVKRFFPGIVLALIALAAYFQGSGIVELAVSSVLGVDAEGLATLPPPSNDAAKASMSSGSKSAEPILSRNPFDSVTGPLNKEALGPLDLPEAEKKTIDLSNPLAAAECDEVTAHIVTESPDPLWSMALLQGPGEDESKLRRIGDDVGDKKVAYIGYNPQKRSPAVWLANPSSLCQALLFGTSSEDESSKKAKSDDEKKSRRAKRARKRRRGAPKVPDEIADKIQKVSDTEFNVDRAVVDNILENQASLMRSARIVPEQKNGKVVGIRLFGVRSDTLLGKLGLKNGDRLESINDFDMTSPEKALEAYARLRTADSLSVKINRRGKPMSIDFRIK